jgi:hypothetical protein
MASRKLPHNMDDNTYIVLVQTSNEDEFDYARSLAFGASRKVRGGSTEYWEETSGSKAAFCFKNWEAAFLFNVNCAANDIRRMLPHG